MIENIDAFIPISKAEHFLTQGSEGLTHELYD
jgi:hypothetical protein